MGRPRQQGVVHCSHPKVNGQVRCRDCHRNYMRALRAKKKLEMPKFNNYGGEINVYPKKYLRS